MDAAANTPESMFSQAELIDIMNAAKERGIGFYDLIHNAVMEDLYR